MCITLAYLFPKNRFDSSIDNHCRESWQVRLRSEAQTGWRILSHPPLIARKLLPRYFCCSWIDVPFSHRQLLVGGTLFFQGLLSHFSNIAKSERRSGGLISFELPNRLGTVSKFTKSLLSAPIRSSQTSYPSRAQRDTIPEEPYQLTLRTGPSDHSSWAQIRPALSPLPRLMILR